MSRYIFIATAAICLFCSCTDGHKSIDALHRADSLMHVHPDSALYILKNINPASLRGRSNKARFALLYAQALDKNCIDVADDSLIRIALDYYQRKGTHHERALAHYYYGCVCANMCDHTAAMASYADAENHASETGDSYLQGLINTRIGQLYCDEDNFGEAQARFHRSERFFREAGARRNEAIALENQGYVSYLLGNLVSAKSSWNAAKAIYAELGDSDAVINIDCSLIPLYVKEGAPLPAIKSSFRQICMDHYGEPLPLAVAGIWLDLYKREGNLDSARLCGLLILEHRPLFTERQISGCYAQLTDIERTARRFEQALQYSDLYQCLADSLSIVARQAAMKKIEQRYNNQLLRESLNTLRLKHRIQLITFMLALVIAAIIVFIIGRAWIRRYKKIREEQRIAKIELEDLHQVYGDLFARFMQMKQLLDRTNERELKIGLAIEERLSGLRQLIEKVPTTKPAAFIKEFKKLVTINTNSKHALFDLQYIVNQKYYGIIDYLKSAYPELNKHDLDLCALMCFGFSQAGICYLYDYSDLGSFYNKRSRLRRKLQLSQSCRIEDFIQRTISELQHASR